MRAIGWRPMNGLKVIFLDIDGVLNRGEFDPETESTSLLPTLVERLRGVLRETGAKIVLSSSWRYLVLGQAMTLSGFEFLLRTHGFPKGCLHDLTCADEETTDRGAQILKWVEQNGPLEAWAVIDDHPVALGEEQWRLVRTAFQVGMTDADARTLTRLLELGQR